MVCYHPLKGFPVGRTKNNKIKYKITGYQVNHVELYDNDIIKESYIKNKSPFARKAIYDFVEVPCGQCKGCRLDYSRQWADRCLLEMQYHTSSYFVTLTYDDDHIKDLIRSYIDYETGECGEVASLKKSDFQNFMKGLRKNYVPKNIVSDLPYSGRLRYFCAGEYGEETFRPHFHAIIFGLELDDLVFYKKSKHGFNYYNSPFLDSIWKKGFVVVAPASWETCAYTARYVMKKQKGQDAEIYKRYNFEPPFTLMSLKPGIGRQFFDENSDKIFDQDYISVGSADGSKKIWPSRYYKKLFEDIDPDQYLDWKNMRLDALPDVRAAKLALTSLNFLDELEIEEAVKEASIKSLKRKSC